MSTKQDLEDEVARLNAVVKSQNETIQRQADTITGKSRDYDVLKASNAHLARYADDLRAQLDEQGLRHVKDIMRLTDLSMKTMSEIAQRAKHVQEIAVERAVSDTIAQCFDRTLQTLANHTAPCTPE